MIVRTYGRRNRGIPRTYSDSLNDAAHDDSFKDSLSQESAPEHGIYSGFAFSSQESSSHWASDSDPYSLNSRPAFDDSIDGVVRRPKKAKKVGKREPEVTKNCSRPSIPSTSTLMEAQEFGEMMEHVDEVNFALDGLKKGQPVRIRRASLLSLLSICGTAQQRRLLRTQGMAKTIVDAILGLSFDDSPSNLAAAALFCVLASDGQDDHLLESPSCIRFLIKLLKPAVSMDTEDKAPKIGCKLLALRNVADICRDTMKRVDSSSAAIVSKVQEVLVSCKELKSSCEDDSGTRMPELCPKWIALLTMEKACLTTIALEETTGAVRKTGGNFKEKLRELGGLDAVFEVVMNCHSDMEGCLEHSSPSTQNIKNDLNLQSLMRLLKCLKIMENATFLSKDNQSHLLGMRGKLELLGTPLSFVELIISLTKILSGLYLFRSSSAASHNEKSYNLPDATGDASELALIEHCKVDSHESIPINASRKCCSTEWGSSQKSFNLSGHPQLVPSSQFDYCTGSETTSTSINGAYSLKMRVSSSTSGSCSGTSRASHCGTLLTSNGSSKNFGLDKRPNFNENAKLELLEDSLDPFAFDEDEFEPSKWDLLSGKQRKSKTRKSAVRRREFEDGYPSQLFMSQEESRNGENSRSHELSPPTAVDEAGSSLLADCLLTTVKVLMNLTNDNPVGCQQISACGGLETMASLIAGHFPSFSSSSFCSSEEKENSLVIDLDQQNDRHLTDQELDFLVAILGLLVNLVEKDGHNRSRLAAARVPLSSLEGFKEESQRDVISLLCSIFLANQGAGEGSGEGKDSPFNDEAAVLQGEKEAEKMIVEAYSALLLAFLSTESQSTRDAIADCLPNRNIAILVPVLDRFVVLISVDF
ncbi:Protein wings apart-like [Morella rubra]|uniref:Protein wings apart-like n=1 Tax=Morella rubra TaxID=262757 RepID=A0A6A1UFV5_9ROSI|nr:Protein wings apart-like [Morella rubra]